MRYFAVDPGKMAGIAMLTLPYENVPATWEYSALEAVRFLDDFLGMAGSTKAIVVCESFVPRPGTRTWQPDALEVIGALRYLSEKHSHVFELQSPAQAKAFSTDDKLKRIGWYTPTKGGHANDAVRHMLLAVVRHGEFDKERLR